MNIFISKICANLHKRTVQFDYLCENQINLFGWISKSRKLGKTFPNVSTMDLRLGWKLLKRSKM